MPRIESPSCSFSYVATQTGLSVAGLFAGIGGIEVGLARSGHRPSSSASVGSRPCSVLEEHFPDVAMAHDIRSVRSLPKVDLVTAGFPCTDLSQAGMTRGITGGQSGLVAEVFRLLRRRRAPTLLLENVRNMLVLDGGRAMRYLVGGARSSRVPMGLSPRRLPGVRCTPASPTRHTVWPLVTKIPARCSSPTTLASRMSAILRRMFTGFIGPRVSVGWGGPRDAVPTLKGGSTIGIPSPPAIWNPAGPMGRRVVVPGIEDAEVLQGFHRGWTSPASRVSRRQGDRWKLVGNAVTVGVAEWVGDRIMRPGLPAVGGSPVCSGDTWPLSAWGAKGKVWAAQLSMWPVRCPYMHLASAVDLSAASPLSVKATMGFYKRAVRSSLRFKEGFLADVNSHACG